MLSSFGDGSVLNFLFWKFVCVCRGFPPKLFPLDPLFIWSSFGCNSQNYLFQINLMAKRGKTQNQSDYIATLKCIESDPRIFLIK